MKKTLLFNKNHKDLKFGMSKKRVLILFGGIFVIFQVFSTIQTATTGAKLASLEEEILSLSQMRKEKETILIDASSLSKISEKAEELGFAKVENAYYAKGSLFVGSLR